MKEKIIKIVIGLILLSAFLMGAYLDGQTLQVFGNF